MKRERHYLIVAVSDAVSTVRVRWCQIPAGYRMALWESEPGTGAICGKCLAMAERV